MFEAYICCKMFHFLRVHAREAAEKARVVEDFHQRRKEAAANKLRGQAQWLAPSPLPQPPQPHGMVAAGAAVGREGLSLYVIQEWKSRIQYQLL